MKTLFKYALVVCSICVLTLGCAVRKEAQKFLPLKPGNEWLYEVDVQGESIQMRVEVGEPKIVEKYNVYPLSYSYNKLALPTQIEYYVVENNTLLFPRIDNVQGQFTKKPVQVFMQFPLKKGKKWEWSGKLVPVGAKNGLMTVKVVSVVKEIEPVTTPAGNYKKAIRISFNSKFKTQGTDFNIIEDRWYVKGVGMVKEVLYDNKGEQVLVAVLKSIKKK